MSSRSTDLVFANSLFIATLHNYRVNYIDELLFSYCLQDSLFGFQQLDYNMSRLNFFFLKFILLGVC